MCVCVCVCTHRDDFGYWGGFWRIGRDCRITKYIKTMKDDTSGGHVPQPKCVCGYGCVCVRANVFVYARVS